MQDAGYPLRLRLDPIVPVEGWKELYADAIRIIFNKVSPERMTIGTLRFEPGFYKMRKTIFTSGPDLPMMMDAMSPMFEPKVFQKGKRPKAGKYSFSEARRAAIFQFVVDDIRKHSDCRIALCKESASVWNAVGLAYQNCECVCQL